MAQRIRTIKPDLFKHEELCDLEAETGLPMRLIFSGLWTVADREGRFKWRPRTLRAEVFPFDSWDMGEAMEALARKGLITRYEVDGESYGYVVKFLSHQAINQREAASKLPPPPVVSENATPTPVTCTHVQEIHEAAESAGTHVGKGREGKGKEGVHASGTRDGESFTPSMAASAVMQKAGISGTELLRNLTDVLRAEQARAPDLEPVVKRMVAAVEEWTQAKAKLQYIPGLPKFFGEGLWRDKATWPWKEGQQPVRRVYANV